MTKPELETELERVRHRRDVWYTRAVSRRKWLIGSAIGNACGLVLVLSMLVFRSHIGVDIPPIKTEPLTVELKQNEPSPPTMSASNGWQELTPAQMASSPAKASVLIGRCSGTIFKVEGEHAWGLTAQHCATLGATTTLRNSDGSRGSATFVAIDRSSDLALFRTKASSVIGVAKLPPPDAKPRFSKSCEAIGYPGGHFPVRRVSLQYKNTHRISNLAQERACYSGAGMIGGESGGSVYYDGYLIGVNSHGGGWHTATLPQMHAFLQKQFNRRWKKPHY